MNQTSSSELDDNMWCVVMFDLPVLTKDQRRAATAFRHLLLDQGFWMVQFSVYVRYTPLAVGAHRAVQVIKQGLPPGGEVRMLHVTDTQWAKAFRFCNGEVLTAPEQPAQLTIF